LRGCKPNEKYNKYIILYHQATTDVNDNGAGDKMNSRHRRKAGFTIKNY
jgi:hypothetical protein